MGIDTPESRTSDPIEKKFGLAAKDRLKQLLGKTAILKTQVDKSGEDMKGKFGRILGDFVVGESTATQILISEGHAVAYFGGSKDDVQEQHKKNRERLIAEGIVTIS
jgi:endonuclease YncB( thermonuclease family)